MRWHEVILEGRVFLPLGDHHHDEGGEKRLTAEGSTTNGEPAACARCRQTISASTARRRPRLKAPRQVVGSEVAEHIRQLVLGEQKTICFYF